MTENKCSEEYIVAMIVLAQCKHMKTRWHTRQACLRNAVRSILTFRVSINQ